MRPVIEFDGVQVFHGDCRDVLAGLPDNSVDSVVTDPPYELGFMGKKWDSTGIAYDAAVWAECLRVLKPGGHILAFGGTRTWHRLAVAVEDAGFEIRDSIAWIYGSGFPKSLDVSKAIDKKVGAEREVSGITKGAGIGGGNTFTDDNWKGIGRDHYERFDEPASPEAEKWQGWGTALKPAHEPIVVGRKPLTGTVAENVLAWGTGGLNIDGSRIASNDSLYRASSVSLGKSGRHDGWDSPWKHDEEAVKSANLRTQQNSEKADRLGRWPANVVFDEVTAGILDEQSGVSAAKPERVGRRGGNGFGFFDDAKSAEKQGKWPADDGGGASRFFYVAKASKRDRNEGLEDLEARRVEIGDERPSGTSWERRNKKQDTPRQNFHPTVKPTALMQYLVKLVTPPGGTVLDPFTGSGSTGKAAILEGFSFIGAELTEEYLPIIEGRLQWAIDNREAVLF